MDLEPTFNTNNFLAVIKFKDGSSHLDQELQRDEIQTSIQAQLTSLFSEIMNPTQLPRRVISFHQYNLTELISNAFDASLIKHRDISKVEISISVNLVHISDEMQSVEINLEGQKPQMLLRVQGQALIFSIVDNGTGVSTTLYGDSSAQTDLKKTLTANGLPLLGGMGSGFSGVRDRVNNKGGFLYLTNKPTNWGQGALVYYIVPVG